MLRLTHVAIPLLIAIHAISSMSYAEQPVTLLGRLAEWQYPGSKFNGATVSDAATLNNRGERTVPSTQCKAVLTTNDPVEKVVEYYKTKLAKSAPSDKAKQTDGSTAKSARSVTYHEDSESRPLTLHIIHVNADQISTVLVISRAKGEPETHIAWTQYVKL